MPVSTTVCLPQLLFACLNYCLPASTNTLEDHTQLGIVKSDIAKVRRHREDKSPTASPGSGGGGVFTRSSNVLNDAR